MLATVLALAMIGAWPVDSGHCPTDAEIRAEKTALESAHQNSERAKARMMASTDKTEIIKLNDEYVQASAAASRQAERLHQFEMTASWCQEDLERKAQAAVDRAKQAELANEIEEQREALIEQENDEYSIWAGDLSYLIYSAALCSMQAVENDGMRKIRAENEDAKIAGLVNKLVLYDSQKSVGMARRAQAKLRSEMRTRKLKTIACSDGRVQKVIALLLVCGGNENESVDCASPKAKGEVRAIVEVLEAATK